MAKILRFIFKKKFPLNSLSILDCIFLNTMKNCFSLFFFSAALLAVGQEIPIPSNFSVVASVYGDLDKDGVDELVVAYNCDKKNQDEESVPRELIIYKKKNKDWIICEQSKNVLLGSKDGGMMGDPFESILIKNGVLSISHYGGSRWKWGYTEKYRFQNKAFYLIGYSSMSGAPCEYLLNSDFNLSTGKIIFTKEYEDCTHSEQEIYKTENETFYKKGIKITLQNRNTNEIKIVSPKYKHQLYLSYYN